MVSIDFEYEGPTGRFSNVFVFRCRVVVFDSAYYVGDGLYLRYVCCDLVGSSLEVIFQGVRLRYLVRVDRGVVPDLLLAVA